MLAWFARNPSDSKDTRSAKPAIFIVAGLCTVAGAGVVSDIPRDLGTGLAVGAATGLLGGGRVSHVLSHLMLNHLYAVYAEILSIVAVAALLQWSIGCPWTRATASGQRSRSRSPNQDGRDQDRHEPA